MPTVLLGFSKYHKPNGVISLIRMDLITQTQCTESAAVLMMMRHSKYMQQIHKNPIKHLL